MFHIPSFLIIFLYYPSKIIMSPSHLKVLEKKDILLSCVSSKHCQDDMAGVINFVLDTHMSESFVHIEYPFYRVTRRYSDMRVHFSTIIFLLSFVL